MRTIITKNINGYDIVTGIDRPVIDPIATMKKVQNDLNVLPELTAFKDKLIEWQKERQDSERKEILLAELKQLKSELKQKRKEVIKNKAVYFEPKTGEEIIAKDDPIIKKFRELKKNKALTKEGDSIPDLRGKEYWIRKDGKWVAEKIESIATELPELAKVKLNKTELKEYADQQEVDRINALSAEDKMAEKESVLDGLLNQAAIKKSRLELKEIPDALAKAKQWHENKKSEIELKYA